MAGMNLIYLASPYSHNAASVREHRYLEARCFTIKMLLKGYALFSPIVYGREMEAQIGTNFEVWQTLNDSMIRAAPEFWVLTIDGWRDSRGVRHELELAYELNKKILFMTTEGERRDANYRHDSAR